MDGRKPRDKASPGSGSNGSGGSGSSSSNLPVTNNKTGFINGESPKSLRRRMSSTSEEGTTMKVNGTASDLGSLDALKTEIMREVRAEIGRLRSDLLEEFARMKQEMIDG